MYQPRFYRYWIENRDLVSFNVMVGETDLHIQARKNLKRKAQKAVVKYRDSLERYIARHPEFLNALEPISAEEDAPLIVKEMVESAKRTNVGPMAGVAGAIAEFVGKDLLDYSPEIIIENGGDIFVKSLKVRNIGIYAGNSPFTKKLAIKILPEETPLGVCTSSGTVGHSLSFGKSDATVAISPSATLADAAATSIGNLIKDESDIPRGIEFARKIRGIRGVLIIKNAKIGIWGNVRISSEKE
jgi:hypothetical protein